MANNCEYIDEIKLFCEANNLRMTLTNNDRKEWSLHVSDGNKFSYLVYTVQDFRKIYEDIKIEYEKK